MLRILCVGQEWRGSNASGLFYALSRVGCAVSIVNDHTYISLAAQNLPMKAVQKLIRPLQVKEFNQHLLTATAVFKPHLILIYKGPFVDPDTLQRWKRMNIPVINFFPDVSFLAHGKNIQDCIPLYDFIFTTKSFGVRDLENNFTIPSSRIQFVPHGFDPIIHRQLNDHTSDSFMCDASFIGTYSAHKEAYLLELKRKLPHANFKIWGNWKRSTEPILQSIIQGVGIYGDLYALAINQSLINISLLSERVVGSSSGDQITSRTFHIPGAGGFMLHQRTDEVLNYFKEGEEMACFDSEEELTEKTSYYLKNEKERVRIQQKGYLRAQKDHSLDARAREMLAVLKQKSILN